MKRLVAILFFTNLILAQEPTTVIDLRSSHFRDGSTITVLAQEPADNPYAPHFGDQPAPKTTREYAVSLLHTYRDYMMKRDAEREGKPDAQGITWTTSSIPGAYWYAESINAGGSKVSIDFDGKVSYSGKELTAEDALVLLVAIQLDQQLKEMEEQDKQEARAKEERASVPPAKLKSGQKTFDVRNVAKVDNKNSLGSTNCDYDHIRILMTDPNKRVGVLHEMMHVATWCNADPALHKAIYELQYPLLKLMQDNPDMVDYLMRRGRDR
jgi:hypothetical protein